MPMSKISPQNHSPGFTLVEFLIALSLFSLILAMIFSTLYAAARSWEAGAVLAGTNDEQRLALGFLRRQIRQTVPLLLVDGPDQQVAFRGETDHMSFVSGLPAHRGGGLSLLTFIIEGQEISLRYRPIFTRPDFFADIPEQSDSVILLRNIKRLQVAYYGRQPDEEKMPDWHDRWYSAKRLPKLIRLRIIARDPHRFLPELLIAIPAGIERGLPQLTLNIGDAAAG